MNLKASFLLSLLVAVPMFKLHAQQSERDSLLNVIRSSRSDTTRVNALYDLSFTYVNSSPDSTIMYGTQSMELARQTGFKKGIANADYVLGAGSFRKGDLKKAEAYFRDCEAIANEISNSGLAIKACIGLGNTNLKLGNLDTAIVAFQKGVAISEETKDDTRLATLLNNIGNIHSNQLRKREAINYYHRSLAVSHRLKDTADLALAFSNLASVYRSLEVLDTALLYVDSTLIMTEKTGDVYTQSMMFGVKGLIEIKQEKYDDALVNLRKSLGAFESQGNSGDAAEIWNSLGEAYYAKKNIDSATYCYAKARDMAEVTGANEAMSSAYAGIKQVLCSKREL